VNERPYQVDELLTVEHRDAGHGEDEPVGVHIERPKPDLAVAGSIDRRPRATP
jgi:hypothetical protein